MWARDVLMPVTGASLHKEVVKELEDNELQPSIDLDSRLVELTCATQEQWVDVNEKLHSKTNIKGQRLRWAQIALAGGLFVCLLLVIWYCIRLHVDTDDWEETWPDAKRRPKTARSAPSRLVRGPSGAESMGRAL